MKSSLLGLCGTKPRSDVHWTILRLRFVFPFGTYGRANGNVNQFHCTQCLLYSKRVSAFPPCFRKGNDAGLRCSLDCPPLTFHFSFRGIRTDERKCRSVSLFSMPPSLKRVVQSVCSAAYKGNDAGLRCSLDCPPFTLLFSFRGIRTDERK